MNCIQFFLALKFLIANRALPVVMRSLISSILYMSSKEMISALAPSSFSAKAYCFKLLLISLFWDNSIHFENAPYKASLLIND